MDNQIDYLLNNPQCINKIVSVVFWGRSGSYLLCSLLDNHTEILTLPFENWAYHYKKFDSYVTILHKMGTQKLIDTISNDLPFLFKDCDRDYPSIKYSLIKMLGESKKEVFGADRDKLCKHLQHALESLKKLESFDAADIFRALNVAYAAATSRTINTRNPTILFNAHDQLMDVLALLPTQFKSCKLIISIRYPIDTYDSHLRHHIHEYVSPPLETLPSRMLRFLLNDQMKINNTETIAVRLEDMHKNPMELSISLAKWLGIEWQPSLLESTVDGYKWYYEKNGVIFSGANPNFVAYNKKCSILSHIDVIKMRYTFEFNCRKWNYPYLKLNYIMSKLIIILFLLPFAIHIKVFIRQVNCERNILGIYKALCALLKDTIVCNAAMLNHRRKRKKDNSAAQLLSIA